MNKFKKGIYHYYRGGEYRIIGEAQLNIDKSKFVVYENMKDGQLWIRSKEELSNEGDTSGKKKIKFEFLREDEDSWENKYMRALADYNNLLKQTAREKQDFIKYSLTDILQNILPVYDHLKMSLLGLDKESEKNPWAVGVKHVLKQFKDVLTARGVEEIKTIGNKFDPNTMEALGGSSDKVKEEIMPGYKLNGRVICPAKVMV
jgi:molecular chaperone GrpE